MTKTAAKLAELRAKPNPTEWERRYIKYLANVVKKQDRARERYYDQKVERARAEGWCA